MRVSNVHRLLAPVHIWTQSHFIPQRNKMESDKKRRQNLSIVEKLELIDRVKAGETREDLVRETVLRLRLRQTFLTIK